MVQRWEPFNELRRMQETMDRMWRGIGTSPAGSVDSPEMESWAIPLDVIAKGDDFIVRATLPGVVPEDIQVSIEDNVLTIKGQTAPHFMNGEGTYLMRERRVGSFHRALRLPDTVDTDKAEPHYEHGVLTVTIPKAEAKKARHLKVAVGSGSTNSNVLEGSRN
jgi:HSP20 family protein